MVFAVFLWLAISACNTGNKDLGHMQKSPIQSQAPESSLHYFEHQTNRYLYLMENVSASLRFTPKIERAYQEDLSNTFIDENLRLFIMGLLCYACFGVLDYVIYPQGFWPANLIRAGVVLVLGALLYLVLNKKIRVHILDITTLSLILAGLQIIVGSTFYEVPVNLAYIAGVLPLFVFILALLRYSYIHTTVTSLVLLVGYTVAVIGLGWTVPDVPELTDYLGRIAPAYIVFLAVISVLGITLTYAIERVHRRNWLRSQIGLIESEQLNYLTNELQQLSVTDSLTGLKNRRFFDQKLHQIWDVCAEAADPVALIMIDVDWFKPFNDNYGHQKGDACLQSIAQLMKQICDKVSLKQGYHNEAVLTRYGGEEFFIILPNTGLKTAIDLAESLRIALYERNLPHAYSPLQRCTMSLGVGAAIPQLVSLADVKDREIAILLKGIDDALYTAKANGKNQVAIA